MGREGMARVDEQGVLDQFIPFDASGEKASLGSALHFQEPFGTACMPCAFFPKGQDRCHRNTWCLYCHFEHVNRSLPKRKRVSKKERCRQARKKEAASRMEGIHTESTLGVAEDSDP